MRDEKTDFFANCNTKHSVGTILTDVEGQTEKYMRGSTQKLRLPGKLAK
jgi:hypothetical protein